MILRFAIGATVELFTGDEKQLNHIAAGNGYCSQNTFDIHFGLDTINYIDSVKVTWPDNKDEVFYNIDVNNKNILIKGNGSFMRQINSNSIVLNSFSIKSVYPNPFNSETTISINAYENISPTIQVFNLKGDLLQESIYRLKRNQKHFIKLSLDAYPTGIYFVRIGSNKRIITKKIQLIK